MTSEDLAAILEAEQQVAAGVLGVQEVVMLQYPDGDLEDTREFPKEVVRQTRRVQLGPPHRVPDKERGYVVPDISRGF